MNATLEEKKTTLFQMIKWPKESIQRISVCVDAYQAISTIDSEFQSEFFQWFLEMADSIWFPYFPQEQDDLSKRKLALNQVLGEADAAKLLELLKDDSSVSYNVEPDATAIPISPDAQLSHADVTRCRAKYSRSVIGLIDLHSNECYTTQKYYYTLWKDFNALLSSCTVEEKGICLYSILLDRRIPYQEVPKGVCMSEQDYRVAVKLIMPSIQKMQFVFALRSTYPTEPASKLLFILEGLKSDEEKIVFLSELMYELRSNEDN